MPFVPIFDVGLRGHAAERMRGGKEGRGTNAPPPPGRETRNRCAAPRPIGEGEQMRRGTDTPLRGGRQGRAGKRNRCAAFVRTDRASAAERVPRNRCAGSRSMKRNRCAAAGARRRNRYAASTGRGSGTDAPLPTGRAGTRAMRNRYVGCPSRPERSGGTDAPRLTARRGRAQRNRCAASRRSPGPGPEGGTDAPSYLRRLRPAAPPPPKPSPTLRVGEGFRSRYPRSRPPPHAVFAAVTPSCFIISSRMTNFWILPVIVIGNWSTKRM